jgi:hypothetical protein
MKNEIYTNGFYKLSDSKLLYAPNWVINANYELRRETHEQNTYPVGGWYWFDTLEEACVFFEINIDDYLPEEKLNDN